MSDILKFACSAPNCGRKFKTQEQLNTHFDLRHPELKKENDNKPSMEKIIKQISKPKLNPQEKHHFLQPIAKRKSKSKIVTNKEIKETKEIKDNKNKKEIIDEEIDMQNIPFSREQKEKKLLNNLFGQINNLENYLEKDFEFHKEFKLPEVPDYDTMYDSDEEKKENKENNKIKKTEKEKKENIYEITEEMIFKNMKENKENETNNNDDKYKDIHELNLSKKNIINFKNNKNITFEKLQELYVLNLSDNLISEANDIKYFENLRELYMNNNKLEDINFCEFLPNLIILNFENNSIITITSLNICVKLKALKLANNQIKYLNSTLRIFKNLKNLEEITIKNNPFLSELNSYRDYFISNYKNIQKFDNEEISEEKRKIAEKFYKENNPVYKNITERPMSSRPGIKKGDKNKTNENNNLYDLFEENSDKSSDEDLNNIMMAKTQNDFRIGDKINLMENKNVNKKKEENIDNKKIIKEEKPKNEEEEKLKKIIDKQKIILDKLKNELEYTSKINREYEMKIDQYNVELNYYNNNDINEEEEDEETKKIKKELEMWKKQYFDLLEKNVNKEEDNNMKFSKDLFNKKNKRNNQQIKKDIIERPQTAQVRSNLTRDFKKLYEEINVLEGKDTKNVFEEVLNEETDEDDDEEENNEEKDNGEEVEKEEKDIKEGNEIEDEIPDDEIEEMFRKSYQDIQKMRKDLQEMNNNMDNKNNKKNNIENILNNDKKGTKLALKPIIKKKENNKNPSENQLFGRHDKKISGKNKNINENNKNSAAQKYNEVLYKLKK